MVLELHIWGPGFSLPSIDPHCLAAIAYFQQAVPEHQWKLVASSNPTLSPTNELPALKNGDVWIGGFHNIVQHLAEVYEGEWVLDARLAKQEVADCIAFSSFVESHGQPLLDLSLYVSSENYTTITRPLYNTIQPFPLPYLTPNSIRAAAELRTDHLGLSGLDIDTENGSPKEHSIIPESLRTPRTTVSSLLAASPEAHAQIRLDALARDFFQPLQDLLGEKMYLVSETELSSLDCLALGYLSLMLIPELPQPWLSKIMWRKFLRLSSWTKDWRERIFGPAVTVEVAFLTNDRNSSTLENKHSLPWQAPNNGGFIGIGGAYFATLADSIPILGQYRREARELQLSKDAAPEHSPAWQAAAIASGAIASVGLLVGYLFHQGVISLGDEQASEKKGLDAYGEAGAVFSVLADEMDAQARQKDLLNNE